MPRTSIKCDADTRAQLKAIKRDGETWDECLRRLAQLAAAADGLLETDGGMQTEYETPPLTGGHPDHRIVVEDPDGSIKTIVLDLRRALEQDPTRESTSPVYMRSGRDTSTGELRVEIAAHAESSLEWLASWLEGTAEHYRTTQVDGSYEYRAAEDLRRAVSEYLATPVTGGDR